jgi:hypothetical protein
VAIGRSFFDAGDSPASETVLHSSVNSAPIAGIICGLGVGVSCVDDGRQIADVTRAVDIARIDVEGEPVLRQFVSRLNAEKRVAWDLLRVPVINLGSVRVSLAEWRRRVRPLHSARGRFRLRRFSELSGLRRV